MAQIEGGHVDDDRVGGVYLAGPDSVNSGPYIQCVYLALCLPTLFPILALVPLAPSVSFSFSSPSLLAHYTRDKNNVR